MINLDEIAKKYYVYEKSDKSVFQRKARILQSLWRDKQQYPIGEHITRKGEERQLGSRLMMPWAKETLNNYLTDNIRNVLHDELVTSGKGKLYAKPRIYNDLLSSQPLCINLFAELTLNLELAAKVFSEMENKEIKTVENIEFEYSPRRRADNYTGDRTAFDVFIKYIKANRKVGFFGIEVKYHENLNDRPAGHKYRYDEIARQMGCFKENCLSKLKAKPLQQIWRDHLLAGSMMQAGNYDEGCYIFLYPKNNDYCNEAIAEYRNCLLNTKTFCVWTLEQITNVIKQNTKENWIDMFIERYLDFNKIDTLQELQ